MFFENPTKKVSYLWKTLNNLRPNKQLLNFESFFFIIQYIYLYYVFFRDKYMIMGYNIFFLHINALMACGQLQISWYVVPWPFLSFKCPWSMWWTQMGQNLEVRFFLGFHSADQKSLRFFSYYLVWGHVCSLTFIPRATLIWHNKYSHGLIQVYEDRLLTQEHAWAVLENAHGPLV